MNLKSCSDCNAEYEAHIGKCPKCNSTYFTVVSPQEEPDSSIDGIVPRVPYVRPKSKFEIEEEQRLQEEEQRALRQIYETRTKTQKIRQIMAENEAKLHLTH